MARRRVDNLSVVFARIRYLIADIAFWVRRHPVRALAGLVVVGGLAVGGVYVAGELSDDNPNSLAPAPQVILRTQEAPEETTDLGFPAFATRNTTRVAGADPFATAAAIALATFPSTAGVDGPDAVTLVDSDDWAGAIAASVLVAAPVSAPILYSDGDELPDLSASALQTLAPQGSAATEGRQIFAIGEAPAPEAVRAREIRGETPAEVAASVLGLRKRLTGEPPAHVLVVSSDNAAYAMPAAAWAARSGDPVLFSQADSVPKPTLDALKELKDVPVYLLGPDDVISEDAQKEIEKALGAKVKRAAEEDDPVANSVEFARYTDGDFGWNINDPGHGFVIANAARPTDAGASAPLSASGTWGPLLVTDDVQTLPPALEGFLLDLKPGYEDDPTRAVYNHIWVIGDTASISVPFQVQVDEIAELAQVRSGSGATTLGPAPGTPEPESDADRDAAAKKGEPADDNKKADR